MTLSTSFLKSYNAHLASSGLPALAPAQAAALGEVVETLIKQVIRGVVASELRRLSWARLVRVKLGL